jgi:hypothetical protein
LLSRHSTTWAITYSSFCSCFFGDGTSKTVCSGWS